MGKDGGATLRSEIDVRKHLTEAIEVRRGIMRMLRPSYQLVISALKWSMGEGKKDNAVPGFGNPRGEDEIRERLETCRKRRDNSMQILAMNWQLIVSSLEWVLCETEITPLEARENFFGSFFG